MRQDITGAENTALIRTLDMEGLSALAAVVPVETDFREEEAPELAAAVVTHQNLVQVQPPVLEAAQRVEAAVIAHRTQRVQKMANSYITAVIWAEIKAETAQYTEPAVVQQQTRQEY